MILKNHQEIGRKYILCKIKSPKDPRDYLEHVLSDEMCDIIVCILIDHNRALQLTEHVIQKLYFIHPIYILNFCLRIR